MSADNELEKREIKRLIDLGRENRNKYYEYNVKLDELNREFDRINAEIKMYRFLLR